MKWNGWHTALVILCMTTLGTVAVADLMPDNQHGLCVPLFGEPSTLSLSGSSVSQQLTPDAAYEIGCDVPVYYEFATGAAPTADSSSQWHGSGSWYFKTHGIGDPYIAALDVSTDGTCWIRRCR